MFFSLGKPGKPTIHVTSGGRFSVDIREILESKRGKELLDKAAEIKVEGDDPPSTKHSTDLAVEKPES